MGKAKGFNWLDDIRAQAGSQVGRSCIQAVSRDAVRIIGEEGRGRDGGSERVTKACGGSRGTEGRTYGGQAKRSRAREGQDDNFQATDHC